MRKLLVGLVTAASLASVPALAADMPLKAPAPVGFYNWSGWYGGINGGGLWGDSTFTAYPAGTTSVSPSISQGMVGFHLGAQWQFATWGPWGLVVGGEYAASVPTAYNTETAQGTLAPCTVGSATSCSLWIDRVLQSGGRIGVTYDRFMVYGTGGYVEADLRTNTVTAAGTAFNTQAREHGWYAGVGAEWMFWKTSWGDWIIGAEWQHLRFDDQVQSPPAAFAGTTGAITVGADVDIVRARLTVKVDPFAGLWGSRPIVTKY
jgi:outer membrane immunogenic protein